MYASSMFNKGRLDTIDSLPFQPGVPGLGSKSNTFAMTKLQVFIMISL